MCKYCPKKVPDLSSSAVYFTIDRQDWVVDPDTGKRVQVESKVGPYVAVCVGHHNGWVTLRSKKNSWRFRETDDSLLAYIARS